MNADINIRTLTLYGLSKFLPQGLIDRLIMPGTPRVLLAIGTNLNNDRIFGHKIK